MENDVSSFIYNHAIQEIPTENDVSSFIYNHATQEIPTEIDVSSFTATAKLKGVGENNVSTDNFRTHDHHTARDLRLKIMSRQIISGHMIITPLATRD